MKRIIIVAIIMLACVVPACSGLAQPTGTSVPLSTVTPLPTPTQVLLLPTGIPDAISTMIPEDGATSEWNDIPIMPGAIAGEGDEESYVFTIEATAQQVQDYYELELGKLGWQASIQDEDLSMVLIFTNDEAETLTINILSKDNQTLVLLVKQGSA
ncbi:MAG TPA: hypothetical protein VFZ43_13605 [Anaerolineales bacterium]